VPSSAAVGLPAIQSISVTQAIRGVVADKGGPWPSFTLNTNEVVRSLGLALLLIVMGRPTPWPRYLTWGPALLAATKAQRSLVVIALSAFAVVVVAEPRGQSLLGGDSRLAVLLGTFALGTWIILGRGWPTLVAAHAS
jgi:hypothetical protein